VDSKITTLGKGLFCTGGAKFCTTANLKVMQRLPNAEEAFRGLTGLDRAVVPSQGSSSVRWIVLKLHWIIPRLGNVSGQVLYCIGC
jgi:hypothetical protein